MKWFHHYFGALIFLGAELAALPPPIPAAGIVERELQREYETVPINPYREIPEIEVDIPKEYLKIAEKQKIRVKHVILLGNQSIRTKEILSWIGDKCDRECNNDDIDEICKIINQHYTEKGFLLARAYLPLQEIREETITIAIVEGNLGRVNVSGNHHYSDRFIIRFFERLQNRPINYDALLQALMLLNEVSDLSAKLVLQKGKVIGTADAVIHVTDHRPFHLYANGNNYGKNLTTNWRGGGRLDWGNAIIYGDKLSVAEAVGFPANALYFTDGIYHFPIGANGWSGELAYLFSRFKVYEKSRFHEKGRSNIATGKINKALRRSRFLSIDIFGSFDYKQIQNIVLGERTSYDKLRVTTIGFNFDGTDRFNGHDLLNIRIAAGIPDFLEGLKAVDSHSSRHGAGGRFVKFNADFNRLQPFYKNNFVYIKVHSQLSPYRLTIPEQYYIGGVDTVRGYPLATSVGDSGYSGTLECRIPPPSVGNRSFLFSRKKKWREVVQLVGFVDHGGTFLRGGDHLFLTSAGAGFRVSGPWTTNFTFDIGFPLSHRDLTKRTFAYFQFTAKPF